MITLKTLHLATRQEVFDQVAKHLLTQKKRSILMNRCRYRGPNGLTCAAGCLIADDEYNHEMEKKSWNTLRRNQKVPEAHDQLIENLQRIHDHGGPEFWPEQLRFLAKMEELEYKFQQPATQKGEEKK